MGIRSSLKSSGTGLRLAHWLALFFRSLLSLFLNACFSVNPIYPLFQIRSKKGSSDKPEPQTNLLNPIRRGYTWAENLIAFSLLFTNLITIYGWDADNDLILSNILQGQAIGLIILATGIKLLLKSSKMCN